MTEAILTIAVVIAASTAAAIFLQNSYQLNNSQLSAAQTAKDAMATQLKIIFATNSSHDEVTLWVKNIGTSYIQLAEINDFNVFFGPVGSTMLVPYNATTLPRWNFTLINVAGAPTAFYPSATVVIQIYLPNNLTGGDYYVRVVSDIGASTDYYFSI
jgi:archaellum component FlaG (FlaF/FlaG flagellin family)